MALIMDTKEYKFDPECKSFNCCGDNPIRTKKRLYEMAEMGLEETGIASFGVEGIVGGLYIEKVWSYTDESFKDYLDWMKSVINDKRKE